MLIDCESMTSDYFPGVSNPGVFGLDETEIFQMMTDLTQADVNLNAVLLSNYNPAVEARRSADCLIYLVYMLLKGLKDKKAGQKEESTVRSKENQALDKDILGELADQQ